MSLEIEKTQIHKQSQRTGEQRSTRMIRRTCFEEKSCYKKINGDDQSTNANYTRKYRHNFPYKEYRLGCHLTAPTRTMTDTWGKPKTNEVCSIEQRGADFWHIHLLPLTVCLHVCVIDEEQDLSIPKDLLAARPHYRHDWEKFKLIDVLLLLFDTA